MAKQQISQRETQVGNLGKQLEQTLIVDDNSLPTPEELAAYKAVDPTIVDFLIETSRKEQDHRHKIDNDKIAIIKKNERKTTTINITGMFFAFLSIIVLVGLSAYALYLDKPWFAGIVGIGTIASVASVFVHKDKGK